MYGLSADVAFVQLRGVCAPRKAHKKNPNSRRNPRGAGGRRGRARRPPPAGTRKPSGTRLTADNSLRFRLLITRLSSRLIFSFVYRRQPGRQHRRHGHRARRGARPCAVEQGPRGRAAEDSTGRAALGRRAFTRFASAWTLLAARRASRVQSGATTQKRAPPLSAVPLTRAGVYMLPPSAAHTGSCA